MGWLVRAGRSATARLTLWKGRNVTQRLIWRGGSEFSCRQAKKKLCSVVRKRSRSFSSIAEKSNSGETRDHWIQGRAHLRVD